MSKELMNKIFNTNKAMIGMVHLRALPGTPRSELSMDQIIQKAVEEAIILEQAGYHALLLENMHDLPYLNKTIGPEVTAAFTAIATQVKQAVNIPIGIQILAGANREALAVALASGASYIRAEGFVFGHIADEGWFESCAGELLRYRKQIGAQHIAVFTDIKKKHSSHQVTSDISISETAKAAELFLADGLIVTGAATAAAADSEEVTAVANSVDIPVLIGSGITEQNLENYYANSDAFIIGSSIKQNGLWSNEIDKIAAAKLINRFETLKN